MQSTWESRSPLIMLHGAADGYGSELYSTRMAIDTPCTANKIFHNIPVAVPIDRVLAVTVTGELSTALPAASLILTTAGLVASGELYTCWVNSKIASKQLYSPP